MKIFNKLSDFTTSTRLKPNDLVNFWDLKYTVDSGFYLYTRPFGSNDQIFINMNLDKQIFVNKVLGRTVEEGWIFPVLDNMEELTKVVKALYKVFEGNNTWEEQVTRVQETTEDLSLRLSNDVSPFKWIAIEPEISKHFYEKEFDHLRKHDESSIITELCWMHEESGKTIRNVVDKVWRQLKYNTTIWSNHKISNWVHFHIFLNRKQYDAIQIWECNNKIKFNILNNPLYAKPVTYMWEQYLSQRTYTWLGDFILSENSKSCSISKKTNYYSHTEEDYDVDEESIEFRFNWVFDFRLTWYYYFLTYCLFEDEDALKIRFKKPKFDRQKLFKWNDTYFNVNSDMQDIPNDMVIATTLRKSPDKIIKLVEEDIKIILTNTRRIVKFLKTRWHDTIAEQLLEYVKENFKK